MNPFSLLLGLVFFPLLWFALLLVGTFTGQPFGMTSWLFHGAGSSGRFGSLLPGWLLVLLSPITLALEVALCPIAVVAWLVIHGCRSSVPRVPFRRSELQGSITPPPAPASPTAKAR